LNGIMIDYYLLLKGVGDNINSIDLYPLYTKYIILILHEI